MDNDFNKKYKTETAHVSKELAKDLNAKIVADLKATEKLGRLRNSEYGSAYAMSSNLDTAITGWLLYHMDHSGMTPRDAMSAMAMLVAETILPRFVEISEVAEAMLEDILADHDITEIPEVAEALRVLREAGYDTEIVAGETQEECFEKIRAIQEGQGETKQ